MRRYLAHPFDARHRVRDWELLVEEQYGIELVNPFYDSPDRTDVEQIDAGRAERYEKLKPIDLVRRDVHQIERTDGILAIIDGSLSYGTIMEIVYACIILHKSVWLIVTNGHHNHPWLVYHSDKIFTSFKGFEMEIAT